MRQHRVDRGLPFRLRNARGNAVIGDDACITFRQRNKDQDTGAVFRSRDAAHAELFDGDAMRDGAVNYLSKPIDLDELLRIVEQTTGKNPAPTASGEFALPAHTIAASPLTRAVFRDAALVAPSESRVLITGESGTGKEVVASLLHRLSNRASKPLVTMNAGGLSEGVAESEDYKRRLAAYQAKALRDSYLVTKVGPSISDTDIKTEYEQLAARVKQTERVRARHILVATQKDADDIEAKLKSGAKFEDLAKKMSKDPGSGANGGDLDPAKGMYWAWNSGYINVKLEGKKYLENGEESVFEYHIGGYLAPFATARNIKLQIKEDKNVLQIGLHLDEWLKQMDMNAVPSVMIPGEKAVRLADQLQPVFKLTNNEP